MTKRDKIILFAGALLTALVLGHMLSIDLKERWGAALPAEVADAEAAQINRELGEDAKGLTVLDKRYLVKCAPCHNRDGSGGVGKPISGLGSKRIEETLLGIKSGTLKNSMMERVVEATSEEDLREIAKVFGE